MVLWSFAQVLHVLLGRLPEVLDIEVAPLLFLVEYALVLHVDLSNALLGKTSFALSSLGSVTLHLVLL